MKFNNKKVAFTLAEVVVVMAILGIMMAAFAPVVTKRAVSSGSNSFKNFTTTDGHTGLFYGTTSDQKTVTIGDTSITNDAHFDPKLLLVSNIFNDTTDKITPAVGFAYKQDSSTAVLYNGQLTMYKNPTDASDYGRLILGGKPNENYDPSSLNRNTTIIGSNACENNTGENVICLGAYSGPSVVTNTPNKVYIGHRDTLYTAANIHFGSTTLDTLINTAMSDIRLKNVGKEFKGGLDEINQLKFYNYTYKRDAEKTPRVGVMAQDLQKVFPNAVNENSEGYLYIRKDDMFFASLNAIKELFVKMTDNSAKIKELEERNAVLEKQVKELQDLYIDLANKVDKKSAKKKLTITPEKPVAEEVEVVPTEEN
ncbi:MAG: tail fiber domain-containing protein [Fusobacterium sp.]|nr:tail fiber domain-containing protein [Fusobacterium sp.]